MTRSVGGRVRMHLDVLFDRELKHDVRVRCRALSKRVLERHTQRHVVPAWIRACVRRHVAPDLKEQRRA